MKTELLQPRRSSLDINAESGAVACSATGRKTAMPETDRQSPLGITVNEAILRDDWAVWAGSRD
jgi:hypothetical protein